MDNCLILLIPIFISLLANKQQLASGTISEKIESFGNELPDYIDKNSSVSWLIKFDRFHCHLCHHLDPIFGNVAEQIYHDQELDKVIVGRVDCDSYRKLCKKYKIKSYPQIVYLNINSSFTYHDVWLTIPMFEFVKRLNSQKEVKQLNSCNELKTLATEHRSLVLFKKPRLSEKKMYNINDFKGISKLYENFRLLAKREKSNYLFYETNLTSCDNLFHNFNNETIEQINDDDVYGLYIIRKHLDKAINFVQNESMIIEEDKLESSMKSWLDFNLLPVSEPLFVWDLNKTLSSGKNLVIAIMGHYKLDLKAAQLAVDFKDLFEIEAKKYIQFVGKGNKSSKLLFDFYWAADLELIGDILIGELPASPNIMILRPNFTYHLVLNENGNEQINHLEDKSYSLAKNLSNLNLTNLLTSFDGLSKLRFETGQSYLVSLRNEFHALYRNHLDSPPHPSLAEEPSDTTTIILFWAILTIVLVYSFLILAYFLIEEKK